MTGQATAPTDATAASPSGYRTPRAKWGVFTLSSAALLAWFFIRPASDDTVAMVGNLAGVALPLLAACWCVPFAWLTGRDRRPGAAQSDRPVVRRAWVWHTLGLLLFSLGQATWLYFCNVLGIQPFPSTADACYLAVYPCLIAALFLTPGQPSSCLGSGRTLLDATLATAALTTVSWHFWLGPVVLGGEGPPLARALATAYPVANLVVVGCLWLTLSDPRGRIAPRVVIPISAGLAVVVLAGAAYGYLLIHGAYAAGGPIDALWPMACMLVGLGVASSHEPVVFSREADTRAPSLLTGLLPYVPVAIVAGLVLYVRAVPTGGGLETGVYAGAIVTTLLVLARQAVAIHENARLNARLRDLVRQLEAAHATLRKSEERMRVAARCTSDVIYQWPVDSDSLEWFGDVDATLGLPAGGFPRTLAAWEDAIHPEDRARVRASLESTLATGAPFVGEYRVIAADGSVRHWSDRAALLTHDGKPAQVIGAVTDVTEAKKAAEIEQERNALRAAIHAQDRVLAIVGHELRTPLAAVRAMAELMITDGGTPEQASAFFRDIHDEVARMSGTVNDLLEVARLSSGTAKWNWGEVDVAAACEAALASVRPLVDASRVALGLSVEPGLRMAGDADAIRRLVLNLVSNACKATPRGRVAVRAAADGQRFVRFEVADTGEGMTPYTAARLGQAFALNSGVVGDSHAKGSGLGLAICKGIVAAHGGELAFRTAPGEGTTVTARLRTDLAGPAGEPEPPAPAIIKAA